MGLNDPQGVAVDAAGNVYVTDVGSDPARMAATADPTEDGTAFILNGEKLWCTNGPIAEIMVVMARTPAKDGKRKGITAFIVESDMPGVSTAHECQSNWRFFT